MAAREHTTRTGDRRVASAAKPSNGVFGSRVTLRVSTAKDRTVKRLLHELVRLGERDRHRGVVRAAMRLRSVLIEIGHEL